MAKDSFKFKQFTVKHGSCAMKVGTDGVLLGAWSNTEGVTRVLDIGTGSGLIALMIAQRSSAQITGLDIDKDAVKE
ncbi:MAG: 50S ribosomal protein L11 methyltransferase, partial [Bacteroidales bacterium]